MAQSPKSREFIISIIAVIAACSIIFYVIIFKLVWIFRMGSLGHWCYLVGTGLYPKDSKKSFTISAVLFSFVVIGSFIPKYFPRLKNLAMVISIFPQLHMLAILNRVNQKISSKVNFQGLTKTIYVYTAVNLATIGWTLLNIFFGGSGTAETDTGTRSRRGWRGK